MKILVGVDLSESTEKVIEKVEEIARSLSAKVWILHVAEPEPDFIGFENSAKYIRDFRSKMFHDEHQQIQKIAGRLRRGGLDATALLVQGATADTLLKEASQLKVDILALGSHRYHKWSKLIMGSVSEDVLHHAKCLLLIIPLSECHTPTPEDGWVNK